MQEKNRPQMRASGGRPLPNACPRRPEDGSLGETCPRLTVCLRTLYPLDPAVLVRFELTLDGSLRLPFATANLKEIHGYAPAAVRGGADALLACIHPQDFDRVVISLIQCCRAVRPWVAEYRILRPPSGTQHWLRSCFVPYARGSLGLMGYGLFLDISAEKESRGELLRLCENATIGVVRTTPEGRYLSANRNFARLCGFADEKELIAESASLVEQCRANPDEIRSLFGLVATRGGIERYALELRVHGGGSTWISLNMRAVRDETGRVEALECYCADISRQVRGEVARGRLTELANTTFPGRDRTPPPDPRADRLCPLLAYVRDNLIWRARLPFPHAGFPTRVRD